MKQVLIIPDRNHLEDSLKLASEYGAGFEYNDFFSPELLDDERKRQDAITLYQERELPSYCTLHGAFYDVIPFSPDPKIREIGKDRIFQSMADARAMKVKAVVFHTGYNPFLTSEGYVEQWIKTNVKVWSDVLTQNPEINVYIENTFEASPMILERLSEQLSMYPNYGICLDYAHACLSKTAPEEWAKRLGCFVRHIHINDNDGLSDLHLAWGDGTLDRDVFYRCYESYFRDATILVETGKKEQTVRSLCKLKEEGFLG